MYELWMKDNKGKALHILEMVRLELEYQALYPKTHRQRDYDCKRMAHLVNHAYHLLTYDENADIPF